MVIHFLKRYIINKKWRKINKHNYTTIRAIYGNMDKVHIGRYTYGEIYVSSPNTEYELWVGDFCSIAGDVKFLLGADHAVDRISTYPFRSMILNNGIDAISKGNIVVGDDVWIGEGAIILSNVNIGQGAVVSAGAVVTRDVPPYAIVGGIPAKVIKYRFRQEIIDRLMRIDYKNLTIEKIEILVNKLSTEISDETEIKDVENIARMINS